MKLNIGDVVDHEGYKSYDIKRGSGDASKIDAVDASFEEVRASHILEHFPHGRILDVLREWVRILRPGGVLKIAVPDFRQIAEQYLAGAPINTMGYVMGGQVDEHDFHKTLFDHEVLSEALRDAGLIAIRRWQDDIDDCSRLPISLNLCGTKPPDVWPKAAAVLSSPRLGFNDFWDCAMLELAPLMPFRRVTGAYWDRDLTHAIEESIADHNPEWILCCDYDTVFTRDQIYTLLDLAVRYPHADAIAPLQTARHHAAPMFTVRGNDGNLISGMAREDLARGEMLRAETAHFGLTLLRVSKLQAMPKPWYNRTYGPNGESDKDPDVQFWHNWKAAGNTLYVALRVPVGHCDLMVRWPSLNFEAMFQQPGEFHKNGIPENVWR
jgi:SAM-dependent methyltransferase